MIFEDGDIVFNIFVQFVNSYDHFCYGDGSLLHHELMNLRLVNKTFSENEKYVKKNSMIGKLQTFVAERKRGGGCVLNLSSEPSLFSCKNFVVFKYPKFKDFPDRGDRASFAQFVRTCYYDRLFYAHPNILKTFGNYLSFDSHPTTFYHSNAITLAKLMEGDFKNLFSDTCVVRMVQQISCALSSLHRHGVSHYGVGPDSIFVDFSYFSAQGCPVFYLSKFSNSRSNLRVPNTFGDLQGLALTALCCLHSNLQVASVYENLFQDFPSNFAEFISVFTTQYETVDGVASPTSTYVDRDHSFAYILFQMFQGRTDFVPTANQVVEKLNKLLPMHNRVESIPFSLFQYTNFNFDPFLKHPNLRFAVETSKIRGEGGQESKYRNFIKLSKFSKESDASNIKDSWKNCVLIFAQVCESMNIYFKNASSAHWRGGVFQKSVYVFYNFLHTIPEVRSINFPFLGEEEFYERFFQASMLACISVACALCNVERVKCVFEELHNIKDLTVCANDIHKVECVVLNTVSPDLAIADTLLSKARKVFGRRNSPGFAVRTSCESLSNILIMYSKPVDLSPLSQLNYEYQFLLENVQKLKLKLPLIKRAIMDCLNDEASIIGRMTTHEGFLPQPFGWDSWHMSPLSRPRMNNHKEKKSILRWVLSKLE